MADAHPAGVASLDRMELPGDSTAKAIAASGLSIYGELDEQPELVFDIVALELRLDAGLRGLELNYPIRTRAKVAKAAVAKILGYPIPEAFLKTRPRFPGQDLDVFVQKANNLQIWNEEVDPNRRYALIRVNDENVVVAVRVLTGEAIALLDRTGTLTSKYQAKRRAGRNGSKLVTITDTERFQLALVPEAEIVPSLLAGMPPTARPCPGRVLSIASVFDTLGDLVGQTIVDPGLVQDRNRGVALQRLVCEVLGLGPYADAGQFPDILCQALEVKLQVSSTIDLGLVTPDDITVAPELGFELRHCDARYAIAYGTQVSTAEVRIESIVVSTGLGFFEEFQRFEGLVQNKKRQIPLPTGIFETKRSPD